MPMNKFIAIIAVICNVSNDIFQSLPAIFKFVNTWRLHVSTILKNTIVPTDLVLFADLMSFAVAVL